MREVWILASLRSRAGITNTGRDRTDSEARLALRAPEVSVGPENRRCLRAVTDGKLAGLQELVAMADREVTIMVIPGRHSLVTAR
jgi:hypothetical protein